MSLARGKWLVALAIVPALGGCGPSREQVLFYEIELAVVSFGIASFLMWLGRVVFDSRLWFVCSYCLKPNARHDVRDGTMAVCLHCGQTTSVNELPPSLVRRVGGEGRLRRLQLRGGTPSRRLLIMLLLAVAFQVVLVLVGLLVLYLVGITGQWPDFDKHRPWHEAAFPLVFALSVEGDPPAWWWFNWILLISYHFAFIIRAFHEHVLSLPGVMATPGNIIAVTLGEIALWWLFVVLGYTLRGRWWLVPGLVAGVNSLVAVVAYAWQWSL